MSDSAFWRFSLAFYARPGVADACLALQDDCAADVNIVLYLLFLALQGHAIDAHGMTRIVALAAPWNDAVVLPLRSVRRRMKDGIPGLPVAPTASLRTEVKRIELEAEHLLQEALEALGCTMQFAPRHESADALANTNLARYADLLAMDHARLQPLLRHFRQHHEHAGPR